MVQWYNGTMVQWYNGIIQGGDKNILRSFCLLKNLDKSLDVVIARNRLVQRRLRKVYFCTAKG